MGRGPVDGELAEACDDICEGRRKQRDVRSAEHHSTERLCEIRYDLWGDKEDGVGEQVRVLDHLDKEPIDNACNKKQKEDINVFREAGRSS